MAESGFAALVSPVARILPMFPCVVSRAAPSLPRRRANGASPAAWTGTGGGATSCAGWPPAVLLLTWVVLQGIRGKERVDAAADIMGIGAPSWHVEAFWDAFATAGKTGTAQL